MKRRWISLTATFLAGLQVQACTSWNVSQESLERIVESDETVRIDTKEFANLELRYPVATSDTLYGMVTEDDRSDSMKNGLIQIPYSDVPGTPVTLARSDIVAVLVYHESGGWVETTSSLDELVNLDRSLALVLRNGSDLSLTNWHVSPDSLFGTQKRAEFESTGWIAIPRFEIDQVAVHRTNVAASLGLAFLVVGGALVTFVAIAFALDPLEMPGLGAN